MKELKNKSVKEYDIFGPNDCLLFFQTKENDFLILFSQKHLI